MQPKIVPPQVPSELAFDFWWHADPAPEIWRLVSGLDIRQQLRFAETVISAQITTAEARVEGMRKVQQVLGELAG